MKKNIHPNYGKTKIITTNGTELTLMSCLLNLSPYHLSTDSLDHFAWTGIKKMATLSGNSARFKKNYSGIEKI